LRHVLIKKVKMKIKCLWIRRGLVKWDFCPKTGWLKRGKRLKTRRFKDIAEGL
jgi:hypothetical protein